MKHLLCIAFLTATAYASPPPMPPAPDPAPTPTPAAIISVPKAVTTNKRGTATIEVTTSGKAVIVANAAEDVTDVFRLYSDDPAKWLFRFEGDAPGSYKLIFITSVNDRPALASCVVTIPGPPTPPVPPTPPTPSDPLTAALQAAYTADAGADKAASLGFLQMVYRSLVAAAPNRSLPTVADAGAWVKAAVEDQALGLKPTQLVAVRKAITAELTATLGPPSSTAPLDAAKFQAELAKVCAALGAVKP